MRKMQIIRDVSTAFKKLNESEKNYVLGVMQGMLVARNAKDNTALSQVDAASPPPARNPHTQ